MKQRFITGYHYSFCKSKNDLRKPGTVKDKTKEYHNAIFVGYDENGIPRHAHKRGLYTIALPGHVEAAIRNQLSPYRANDTLYVFKPHRHTLKHHLYPSWKQTAMWL